MCALWDYSAPEYHAGLRIVVTAAFFFFFFSLAKQHQNNIETQTRISDQMHILTDSLAKVH